MGFLYVYSFADVYFLAYFHKIRIKMQEKHSNNEQRFVDIVVSGEYNIKYDRIRIYIIYMGE